MYRSRCSLPWSLIRWGKISQAEQTYREVLKMDPKNADVRHLLGVAALQTGEPIIALP